jgi:hypothetical protein
MRPVLFPGSFLRRRLTPKNQSQTRKKGAKSFDLAIHAGKLVKRRSTWAFLFGHWQKKAIDGPLAPGGCLSGSCLPIFMNEVNTF